MVATPKPQANAAPDADADAAAAADAIAAKKRVLWYRHHDKAGQTYFFNRATHQSTWDEPTGPGVRIVDYVRSQVCLCAESMCVRLACVCA